MRKIESFGSGIGLDCRACEAWNMYTFLCGMLRRTCCKRGSMRMELEAAVSKVCAGADSRAARG